jgi:subtilisin family serine protease
VRAHEPPELRLERAQALRGLALECAEPCEFAVLVDEFLESLAAERADDLPHHVGVAPGALLHCARVIEGGDIVARILGGMDWALGQGVRVLSMSLGIRGLVPDFQDIIDILRLNRVLPVIAAGNEGPGSSRSPGN